MAKSGMMRCLSLATGAGFGLAVAGRQALAAGASEPGLPQLDISTWPSQIFWLIVIFGVGYVMMAKIVTPKIGTVLEDRRTRLDGDLGKAREASTEAAKIRAEYEADLESARNDAAAFARKAADEAAEKAASVEGKAAKKLASKGATAEKKLATAKAEAMENLNTVAAEAALDAVKGLTGITATKAQAEKAVKAAAKAMVPQESN
jgi:F-type H+-transporting ATPase subunit b